MKILWLSHFLPYPLRDGAKQRSFNLIKEIAKQHTVYLIALNHEKIDQTEAAVALKQFCHSVEIINFPANNFYKSWRAVTSLFSTKPYFVRWLQSKKACLVIRRAVKESAFDIVHFDGISVCAYLRETENLTKVLNHHNIESLMMLRRSFKEKNLAKKMYFFLEAIKLNRHEKSICQKFDCNLTVSSLDKERLLGICPGLKIEVIPNGVDVEYFKPCGKDGESNSLIFAGAMTWYPNRDAMLFFAKEVWPLLKKRLATAKMTVLGSNPPAYLLQLCRKDPNLVITGFVEDVRPYLEKAQVYICPIRDGGGTKLKILNALAMGKPVVAHPVAIEGLDLEAEKHLLLAQTPLEFIQQISRLFTDASLRDKLSHEGRKLAIEKYDFREIGEKLSKLYNLINEQSH